MRNLWLLLSFLITSVCAQNFEEEIHFIVFIDNAPVNTSEFSTKNPVKLGLCDAGDELAVIVHGWQESCSTVWLVDLVSNLTLARGGCIICMDYSHFSDNNNYFALMQQFNQIRDVLYKRMDDYRTSGLYPSDTYMFGFSFGGPLVLQAAALLGERVIKTIDVCEVAGLGLSDMPDATIAAQNVQCIHTSYASTPKRNCHQNWNMGYCGLDQGGGPQSSHGLCPKFYNSAFKNDFLATERPFLCLPTARDTNAYPKGFKMGYMETRKEEVFGTLYCPTTRDYPYN